jgi:hypothetical protein
VLRYELPVQTFFRTTTQSGPLRRHAPRDRHLAFRVGIDGCVGMTVAQVDPEIAVFGNVYSLQLRNQ